MLRKAAAEFIGSAFLLLAQAVQRLLWPEPVAHAPIGIAVMLLSIVVTAGLVFYQRHVVRQTGSLAIGADELHYRSDIVLNGSVIAALVLGGMIGSPVVDPLFGTGIGVWIIYSAARLLRLSLRQLMDQELPDNERAKIRAVAQAHPEVTAVHDIRTRVAGPTAFIQMHIEMDGGLSLLRAHEISDEVEADLQAAYPNAEIIIHQDPAGLEEPPVFPARAGAR